jgi:hypothetical protein
MNPRMEQGKEEAAFLSSQFFLCFSFNTSSVTEFKGSKKNVRQAPTPLSPKEEKTNMFSTHVVFLLLVIFLYICIIYVLCRQSKLENLRPTPPTFFFFLKKKLDLTTTHPLSRLIPCYMPRSYKRQPRRRRRRQKQLCHQKEERTSSLTLSFVLARMPSHRVEPHAVKRSSDREKNEFQLAMRSR